MPEIDLFHLRITYKEENLNLIIKFIVDNADSLVIVHEVSVNKVPHIHCVLNGFKQTKSTFIQKFTKLFPSLAGNQSYMCVKKKDREAQLRYCCKGYENISPDVRYKDKNIDVDFYHLEFWKENLLLKAKSKEVNMGLQKDSSLVLKTKSKTWTEKTFEEIQDKCKDEIRIIRGYKLLYNASESEKRKEEIAQAAIFELMLRCLGRGAKKMNNNILFDMFNGFINGIYCLQIGDETDPVPIHAAGLFQLYLTKKKFGN